MDAAPPPPVTLSGKKEVEVEGKLNEDEPPLVQKQKGCKGRGNKGPPMQPTHQSAWLQKPSTTIQRIQAGEGTTREDLTDLADCDAGEPEWCEWANLVGYEEAIAVTIQEAEGDPKTMQEAQACNDWPSWKEAMDHEISSLEQARTWTMVPHPTGKNVVGCKWVFRLKRKVDGSIDKYKAHLVARGFMQIYGIDYYNTYSLVICLTSFRLILAIAAHNNWKVEVFNFNSAYLNGKLNTDEEIYMQELPGYEIATGDRVKKLLKALYGLKQAGHKWYDVLYGALMDLGFHIARADPRVFIVQVGDSVLLLVVHVDHCTMTGSSAKLIAIYKVKLYK
jgi:Reverse transcriptase (RNA-dependent DNA polymerase)